MAISGSKTSEAMSNPYPKGTLLHESWEYERAMHELGQAILAVPAVAWYVRQCERLLTWLSNLAILRISTKKPRHEAGANKGEVSCDASSQGASSQQPL